jgi:RNA-directed DNA polymerase
MKQNVHRLQMRIAKAHRERRHGKVKALQWILTHSLSAKLLAVKRVTENHGANTPGVDNIIWNTPKKKIEAVKSLSRRSYKTKPLKRIYIPKKQKGKFRPLSIPAIQCRAMQALHLLALEPVSENMADKNAYGFRPMRSAADATRQCFTVLSRRDCAKFILEGDIRSCYDNISHQWLMDNVPMDKKMLGKWLTAGYIDNGKLNPTMVGVSQGGKCKALHFAPYAKKVIMQSKPLQAA